MRKFCAIILAFLLLLISAPANSSDLIPREFQFEGTGYGHGVGMSQIGARGLALEGRSAAEILTYYYPGTQLAPYPDNTLIRVNIANQTATANLSLEKGL